MSTILSGMYLLLVTLAGFSLFSMKMPKGQAAMSGMANAAISVPISMGANPVLAVVAGTLIIAPIARFAALSAISFYSEKRQPKTGLP